MALARTAPLSLPHIPVIGACLMSKNKRYRITDDDLNQLQNRTLDEELIDGYSR